MKYRSGRRLGILVTVALLGACADEKEPRRQDTDSVVEEEPAEGDETSGETTKPSSKPDARVSGGGKDAGGKDDDKSDGGALPDDMVDMTVPKPSNDKSDAGTLPAKPDSGTTGTSGGACCDDGDCLCHGDEPKALTSSNGPFKTESYSIAGTGCVFYPTDAEPPFAAVAVSDGYIGTGGCGPSQTGQWAPFYASWGIVTMIVNTGSNDYPEVRGMALSKGIAAFKSENKKSGSPLEGKLAGRYGTSGFSMGGGGTTFASVADPSLRTSVAIMPWGPARKGIEVPTLVICGSSDGTAACASHGTPAYNGIADSVPKMRVQVTSNHAGQPSAGMGKSGSYGLAFQKVFLENDQRWRPLLVAAESQATNIK